MASPAREALMRGDFAAVRRHAAAMVAVPATAAEARFLLGVAEAGEGRVAAGLAQLEAAVALAQTAEFRAHQARLLILLYGLHGAGMVPPMVYLADLAARGRGLGVEIGALLWLVFGLAGVAGGVLSGRVVDRLGGRPTLRLWLLIQAVALALALPPFTALVLPAAAAAGFAAVGVTAVTLGVTREMAGARATGLWVQCTAAFAVTQTVVGFALAAVFAATGESHAAVFGAGFAFSLAAFAAAVALARQPPVRLADR